MSLNASFSSTHAVPARRTLQGPSRGLDIVVGLIITITALLITSLGISALYELELAIAQCAPSVVAAGQDCAARLQRGQVGFGIAVFGCGIVLGITTLSYLIRIIIGRRSFVAPLVGLFLSSIVLVVSYGIMLL